MCIKHLSWASLYYDYISWIYYSKNIINSLILQTVEPRYMWRSCLLLAYSSNWESQDYFSCPSPVDHIWRGAHRMPEKAMALHSSTLAWKIPWMEEPGGLQSMGSLRVGHDWATSLSLFTFMHWKRKWQPTHVLDWRITGMGSLVGCCLWGRIKSDTTEAI